jgi:hypothetical protein
MSAITDISEAELSARAGTMLMEILRRTHLSAAHDMSAVVAEESRTLGLAGVVLYVVDYEERTLVPVPGPGAGGRQPLPVQGTVAGRSYAAGEILDVAADEGRRVWLPLLDSTDRIGGRGVRLGRAARPARRARRWRCLSASRTSSPA